MRILVRFVAIVAVLLLAVGQVSRLSAGETGEPIILTLRADATVSGSQVSVGDVAALEGGDAQQRERIAKLDLAELPLSSRPILVSQQQIDFRLQVAGIDDRAFRLEGPRFVRVSRPAAEALDNKIAAVARQAVEQKLPGGTEDAAIQLVQPVRLPPLSAEGEDIHLEAELRGPVTVPGRVMVEVGIYIRGARRQGLPVYLEVKKLQPAPVAIRRIEVGEAFSADNVRVERVAVENPAKTALDAAGVIGQHARRIVNAGHLIEPADVQSAVPAGVVIHQRDLIHILAKVGPLQVKARGEAMQEGRIGQLIQVRNVDSNATVAGRVVDRSTVEVDY